MQGIKLAASNIGWDMAENEKVFRVMEKYGFTGLEIAPTKFFPEDPYDHAQEMKEVAGQIYEEYGFLVCSMQSIWYGRQEKVFGTASERQILVDYTKRAMDFAAKIGCNNLVFGSPKNRAVPEGMSKSEVDSISAEFFGTLAEYAKNAGTVLALEANPPIYNTNFVNATDEAASLVKTIGSSGFKVNLDIGTMIENKEEMDVIDASLINHVHFSEPFIKPLERRELHGDVCKALTEQGYEGFFSVEVGGQNPVDAVIQSIEYIGELHV